MSQAKATAKEVPILVAKGERDELIPKYEEVVVDGHSFVVEPGVTRISAGHPLAKARPDLFEKDQDATSTTPTRRRRGA